MADFEQHHEEFKKLKARVVAASVDSQQEALETIEELKLSYPVAYGLKSREIAKQTGAFFSEAKEYLHATGFILDADGKVAEAVYSTGPIGRLTAEDAVALLTNLNEKKE